MSESEAAAFEQEMRELFNNTRKARSSMPTYIIPFVGDFHRLRDPISPVPATAILKALPTGAPLILEREFDNAYDSNAIKVLWDPETIPSHPADLDQLIEQSINPFGFTLSDLLSHSTTLHLGFIANGVKTGGKFADEIAPMMDAAGREFCPCFLSTMPNGKFAVKWGTESLGEPA